MSTVYLHIGLHKTGTSSIQRFLDLNNELLKAHEDLVYFKPDPWPLPFKGEKPSINLQLNGFEELKNIKNQKIVISHENYSWMFEEKQIKKLSDRIKKFCSQLKIILYIRRQDSLSISQKQEGTKWLDNSVAYGHSEGALPSKLNYFSKNYLDFYKKVDSWANAVGKDNVLLRVFDKDQLLDGDVVKDFFNQLGVSDLTPYRSVGRVNESMSRKKQIFLHRTRARFGENTPEKLFLVKHIQNLDINDHEKLMPSREQAVNFYSAYKDSNVRLRKEYGDGEALDFFNDDFSMYPVESNFSRLKLDEYIEYFYSAIKSLLAEVDELKQKVDVEQEVAQLRGYALKAEKFDVRLAFEIMSRAHALKPNGPFIKGKIKEYKERMKADSES